VTASIRKQVYGLNQFYWEGWDDAAQNPTGHSGFREASF